MVMGFGSSTKVTHGNYESDRKRKLLLTALSPRSSFKGHRKYALYSISVTYTYSVTIFAL